MEQVHIEQIRLIHAALHATLLLVYISQLLDITVCNVVYGAPAWSSACTINQFILGTAMCTLVTVKFVKDSLQMYQATRKWQLNRYMNHLVRDGLLYFLVYVPQFGSLFYQHSELTRQHTMTSTLLYSIIKVLDILGSIPEGWISHFSVVIANVPLFNLTPRFVMNIRELHALDMQGRCNGDIDTDFGLSSGTSYGVERPMSIGT